MEEKSNPIVDGHQNNGGWQQVTYAKKKQQKNNIKKNLATTKLSSDPNINNDNKTSNVFESLEKYSTETRNNIEARKASKVFEDDEKFVVISSNHRPENGGNGKSKTNGAVEEKEKKKKKEKMDTKKTNMTVVEAAVKIDANDLASFLADTSASHASQQDIQLTRFADYFGRAFSAVSSAMFPWLKLLKESNVDTIADVSGFLELAPP